MHGMSLTEPAVLLGFHSFRMVLLFLGQVVIALMALCTFQCDSYTHDLHLRLNNVNRMSVRAYYSRKQTELL